jgi:hypothetical protein
MGASRSEAPRSAASSPPLHAFLFHQVLEMRNHHDGIPHSDAEQSHKSHQRPERQVAACQPRRQNPSHQRKGKVQKHQQEVAIVSHHHAEYQDDPQGRQRRMDQQFLVRMPLGLGRASKFNVSALRELQL